ncbi:hypothetical protein HYU16_04085 [Candidatus Woesearchaeota archaeon]|nr:hypothetical protein [Candidatus Woesearchaeota archaeon]
MVGLNLKAMYDDTSWRDNLPYEVRKSNSIPKIVKYLLKTSQYSLHFAADSDFKKTNEKMKQIKKLGGLKYQLIGEVVAITASEREVLTSTLNKPGVYNAVKDKIVPKAYIQTEAGIVFTVDNKSGALKVEDYIEQEGRFYVDLGMQITASTKKVLVKKDVRKYNGKKSFYINFILVLENIKQETEILSNRVSSVKRGFVYETARQYIDYNNNYYYPSDNHYFREGYFDLNAKPFHNATITKWLLKYHGKDSDKKERMSGIIHLSLKNLQGKPLGLKASFSGQKPEQFRFDDLGYLKKRNVGKNVVELKGFMRDNSQFEQIKKGNTIQALFELTCYPPKADKLTKPVRKLSVASKSTKGEYATYTAIGKIISISSEYKRNDSTGVLIDCGINLFAEVPKDVPFNVGDFIRITGQLKLTLVKNVTELEKSDSSIIQLFSVFDSNNTSQERVNAIRNLK